MCINPCEGNIERAIEMSREMLLLADEGQATSVDNGCAVLYGIMRDCAYRIRAEAQREQALHRAHRRSEDSAETKEEERGGG